MIEGCLERPKTSSPRRNTRVATYWFAPLIRLTTAITAATPITTPKSVSTLRSLCAHKLEVAMATDSEKFIDRFAVVLESARFAVVPAVSLSGWSMDKAMRNGLILTYADTKAGVTLRGTAVLVVYGPTSERRCLASFSMRFSWPFRSLG